MVQKMKMVDGKMQPVKSPEQLTQEWKKLKEVAINKLNLRDQELASLDGLKLSAKGKLIFDRDAGGKSEAIKSLKALIEKKKGSEYVVEKSQEGATDNSIEEKPDNDSKEVEETESFNTEQVVESAQVELIKKTAEKVKDKLEEGFNWDDFGADDNTKKTIIKLLIRSFLEKNIRDSGQVEEKDITNLIDKAIG